MSEPKQPGTLRAAAWIKGRITRYFNECRADDQPATPAGLALALNMRTEDLTCDRLPEAYRPAVAQALQRIETETLQRALSGKGGAKGVEVVLQQTARALGETDEMSALTDEELKMRMKNAIAALQKMIRKD